MAYPVLPGFDTSDLDASKNGQELCNELKRLYDYLMTAVTCQKFKWDSVDYTYNSDGLCTRVKFKIGGITIEKYYSYINDKLNNQTSWIIGVPPDPASWYYIHGQTYNYDSEGRVTSVKNKNQ